MALVMDAASTTEKVERLEKVLGIAYKRVGNVEYVECRFGGLSKEVVV